MNYFAKPLRKLSLILASILILATLFSGCSKEKEASNINDDSNNNSTESKKESNNKNTDSDITLTYWTSIHGSATHLISSYENNDVYKELEKRTGIKIKFLHPAEGQEKEQFNLMLVSNKLPDIIQYDFESSYPGGAQKAIDDGVILRLNDLVTKYAPNFDKARNCDKSILEWDVSENYDFGTWEGWDKACLTNNGDIWCFSQIELAAEPCYFGPIIREDLLDKLNLEKPSTIEDWHKTLTAFKEDGIQYPLLFPKSGVDWQGSFLSAYDIGPDFYQVDSNVKYGPIEQGFKQYLQLMNKWYKEGLIDKDFVTRDTKSLIALLANGQAGSWVGAIADIEQCIKSKTDDSFKFSAIANPSLEKGTKTKYRQFDTAYPYNATVITSSCKHPEKAVKWFDYAYSKEGYILFNYGLEGVCHEIVDGKYEFTEDMTNNPDGKPFYGLSFVHKLANGPFLRSFRASNYMFLQDKTLYDMRMTWTKGADNTYGLPYLTLTDDENKDYAKIMSDINTYKDEMILKFILGAEPIEKFDQYVDKIKELKIDEAIKYKQNALDRYSSK